MLRLISLALVALTACSAPRVAPEASGALDGVWRLQSTEAFDASGESAYAPEVQTGILVVSGGHYSWMWTRSPRPDHTQHWAATDAERIQSFNTMIAHAGRITPTHRDTLRLDAEAAKSPEFVGGHERFAFRLEGDTLRMTAVWAESASGVAVPFYAARGRQDYVFTRER